MAARILDGAAIAAAIRRELMPRVEAFRARHGRGPGLGIDCAARAGIHVWEDHYLVEIVDPISGAPRPDGMEGELVISTLTREGLPLVRYRTHDVTRVLSRARCDCGRTSLRLDRLRGRTDDMVIVKGVNFYPQQVERLVLRHAGVGPEYQMVLEDGERVVVLLEAEAECDPAIAVRIRRDLHDGGLAVIGRDEAQVGQARAEQGGEVAAVRVEDVGHAGEARRPRRARPAAERDHPPADDRRAR